MRDKFKLPKFIKQMNKNNWLGDKTNQGFYKKTKDLNNKSIIEALNLNTMQYAPRKSEIYNH